MRRRQFFLIALTVILVLTVVTLVMSARMRSQPSLVRVAHTSSQSSLPSSLAAGMFRVTHVVDGDTIDVTDASGTKHRVRFIGIDTPETVDQRKKIQCYGPEASARMKDLIEGESVMFEANPAEDTDDYGRWLRYVFLGSTDIGAQMLEEGYARSLCAAFPHPKCATYDALEVQAKANGVGRWGVCR